MLIRAVGNELFSVNINEYYKYILNRLFSNNHNEMR